MKSTKKTGSNQISNQDGFTIVELMIATLIFSVVLIVLTQTLVYITNAYYKGVVQENTQNVARNIVNSIGEDIQFSGAVPVAANANNNDNTIPEGANGSGNTLGWCIGSQLYTYIIGIEVENTPNFINSQGYHALAVQPKPGCSNLTRIQNLGGASGQNLPAGSQELLGQNMRLANLAITSLGDEMYQINATVVYGDASVLKNATLPDASCMGGDASQFCAVSELATVVQMRVQ